MPVHFRPFAPGDEGAFRSLNEAWIVQFFALEPKDHVVLADPETHILRQGGHIFMGVDGEQAVACCALIPKEPGCFELSKMSVLAARRGQGIGRRLIAYAIEQARVLGIERLYLESNTKLPNAVHLYEAAGFRHLPPERVVPSAYARSNVYMELFLQVEALPERSTQ
jgi:putative acetyltransferase